MCDIIEFDKLDVYTAMLHKIIETTFLCDVIEFSKLNTYSDAVERIALPAPSGAGGTATACSVLKKKANTKWTWTEE